MKYYINYLHYLFMTNFVVNDILLFLMFFS
jgi:hypothetical protein